jgi:hypothetical protein
MNTFADKTLTFNDKPRCAGSLLAAVFGSVSFYILLREFNVSRLF